MKCACYRVHGLTGCVGLCGSIAPGGNDWTPPDPKPHGTSGRVDVIHSARTPNKRELRRMKRKERS